jgi:hypothetical protein
MRNESRFRMIERADPARFKQFLDEAQAAAIRRYSGYQQLASIKLPYGESKEEQPVSSNGDGLENK